MSFEIRPATPADVDDIHRLIVELATYEREPESVVSTTQDLHAALFSESPQAFGHVVVADGSIVGMAIWFLNFSTWTGKHGVYLEDLYVQPEQRGRGLGKELLKTLARVCVAHGYTRLEWAVLDWNEPSIGFYKSLDATPMDEWTVFRLAGDALTELSS